MALTYVGGEDDLPLARGCRFENLLLLLWREAAVQDIDLSHIIEISVTNESRVRIWRYLYVRLAQSILSFQKTEDLVDRLDARKKD